MPLIVLAYILYWPVGIVLTVLRSISVNQTKGGSAASAKPYEPYRQTGAQQTSQQGSTQNVQNGKSGQNQRTQTSNPYFESQMEKKSVKKARSSGKYKAFVIGAILCFALGALFCVNTNWNEFFSFALPFLAGGAAFTGASVFTRKSDTRINRIRAMVGNRPSMNLARLAAASGASIKQIRKDVQKMIDKGEFGEYAYIDLSTNNFMRTPDAEPDDLEQFDYRTVYGDLLNKDKKNEPKQEKAPEQPAEPEPEKQTDDEFTTIIKEIRRLNDEIADIPVSDRIDQIEAHTRNIFDYVRDHPEAMPQIRTFMNYYLPTTLKLLESYSRIERVGVAGENMKKSKENIESILDLLVVGFEQQVDQLFRNESIDISSDISVLEKMMQKDGLSGKNDFNIQTFVDGYTDEISDDLSAGGAAAAKAPDQTNS